MRIKQGMEEWWQTGLDNNQDFYGSGVYDFAARWADLMEADIEAVGDAQKAIVANAEKRSSEADTDGITGFMYGCAVSILSQAWEYGEILRKWHNREYGYEGDGCVNPAILTIK